MDENVELQVYWIGTLPPIADEIISPSDRRTRSKVTYSANWCRTSNRFCQKKDKVPFTQVCMHESYLGQFVDRPKGMISLVGRKLSGELVYLLSCSTNQWHPPLITRNKRFESMRGTNSCIWSRHLPSLFWRTIFGANSTLISLCRGDHKPPAVGKTKRTCRIIVCYTGFKSPVFWGRKRTHVMVNEETLIFHRIYSTKRGIYSA